MKQRFKIIFGLVGETTMTNVAGRLMEPVCGASVEASLLPPPIDSSLGHTVNKNVSEPIVLKEKSMAEIVRQGKWPRVTSSEFISKTKEHEIVSL